MNPFISDHTHEIQKLQLTITCLNLLLMAYAEKMLPPHTPFEKQGHHQISYAIWRITDEVANSGKRDWGHDVIWQLWGQCVNIQIPAPDEIRQELKPLHEKLKALKQKSFFKKVNRT